jgi:hypothetical protein
MTRLSTSSDQDLEAMTDTRVTITTPSNVDCLWKAGNVNVDHAFMGNNKVYPTPNITYAMNSAFSALPGMPKEFAHIDPNNVPSTVPSYKTPITMFSREWDDGNDRWATDGYGWNSDAPATWYKLATSRPTGTGWNWYPWGDWKWTTDPQNIPYFVMDTINLNARWTISGKDGHFYGFQGYQLMYVPNRTITVDDVVDVQLSARGYMLFGTVPDELPDQLWFVQLPSNLFDITNLGTGLPETRVEDVVLFIGINGTHIDYQFLPDAPGGGRHGLRLEELHPNG